MNQNSKVTPEQVEAFRTSQIAVLNDELRASIDCPKANTIVLTQSIVAMTYGNRDEAALRQAELFRIIKEYSDFGEDNDPYGEREFGSFQWMGEKCFWKIDYYDKSMKWGSEDPTDESVTHRVLTIMQASEY